MNVEAQLPTLRARRLHLFTQHDAIVLMQKDCPVCRGSGRTDGKPKPWHPEARWQQLGQAGNPERDPRLRYADLPDTLKAFRDWAHDDSGISSTYQLTRNQALRLLSWAGVARKGRILPRAPLVLDDQESDDPLDWHPKKEEPAGPSDEETLPPELTEPHLAWLERGAPDGEDPAQWYRAGRASLAEELNRERQASSAYLDEGMRAVTEKAKRILELEAELSAKDQRIAELEAKNAELEAKVEAWAPVVETVSRVRRWAEDAGPVNEAFAAIPEALRPKA
jgi:hypothetical protein